MERVQWMRSTSKMKSGDGLYAEALIERTLGGCDDSVRQPPLLVGSNTHSSGE